MAASKKLVLKKLPKKPKASASVSVKENYLKKVTAIKKENDKRKREFESNKKKNLALSKKIAGIK